MRGTAHAVARLERSSRSFLALLEDVSESGWRLRPSGETWSIAETVEHVVLTNRAVRATLGRLHTAPRPAGARRLGDGRISAAMFDAAPAPPGLADPTGSLATRREGIAALTGSRAELVDWARESEIDLRAYALPHPAFGLFDGVQWILFAAAHTDNHLPQLRALRAHPELASPDPSR